MKKKWIAILSAVVVFVLALTTVACTQKHVHEYSEKFVGNDAEHWYECKVEGCDRPKVEQGAHEDDDMNGLCDICGLATHVRVAGVDLGMSEYRMKVDEVHQFSFTYKNPADRGRAVKWWSVDNSVVSVDQDGNVTARAVGSTRIVVQLDQETTYCTIYVDEAEIRVISVSLTDEQRYPIVGVGETFQLYPSVFPWNATNQNVSYRSNDEEVATVDQSGLITGKKTGTANITVTTEDGGKTATCTISVGTPAESVTIDGIGNSDLALAVGESLTLTATVLPADAVNKKITWRVNASPTGCVTVDEDGTVHAVSAGVADVIAETSNGKSDTIVVVVTAAVRGVRFEKTELTLAKGETVTLEPIFTPANPTNRNVSWESSDESVLTVDNNGKITPVAKGRARVTVTTEDGGYTATCDVEIVVRVTGVSVESEATVGRGRTKQLHAVFTPADPTNANVTWTVTPDNRGITVDENGLVAASDEADGSVKVRVTTEDGNYYAECTVTIGVPVEGVSIHNTRDGNITDKVLYLTYNAGFVDTYKIFEVINPTAASNQNVTWEVTNPYVIDFAEDGTVTAVGIGTSNVTVTTEDGGFTATCGFIVMDALQYVADGEGYMVSGLHNQSATRIVVPKEHDGRPVTAIGGGVFQNASVSALTIPNTVTAIGSNLFPVSRYVTVNYAGTLAEWCNISSVQGVFGNPWHTTVYVRSDDDESWLRLQGDRDVTVTSLTLPDGMESIGAYALYESNVTEISLPATLKEIGRSAFNSIGTMNITFRGTIGQWCEIEGLEDCMATEYYGRKVIIDGVDIATLATVAIEDGTAKIADGAFHQGRNGYSYPIYNDTLVNVIIPASVESIGNKAFHNCRELTNVYFKGTQAQWTAMITPFANQTVYFYSQDIPGQTGNFWHYDVDEKTPVVWTEFNVVNVERIELEHEELQLAQGNQIVMKAFAYPEEASEKGVTWSIPDANDRGKATIDWQTGELKVNVGASGSFTVKATSKDYDNGEISATCTVAIGTTASYERRKTNGTDYDEEWYVASSSNYFYPTKVVLASVHYPMGGDGRTSYEVTEIAAGAFKTLSVLEEIWIPGSITKISTEALFHANSAVTIYYDITLEEAKEMDLSGFFAGAADGVERKVYFRDPETGKINVPMPQED